MISDYDGPRRTYRLVLDLEADSYDQLVNALDQIGMDLLQYPKRAGGESTSGGYGSGWHLELSYNERQTGDRYRSELTEWCNRRREERAAREARHE